MDVRRVFQAASLKLTADFEESATIQHSGGKGAAREDALLRFMAEKLPLRYAIGRGEVINPENVTSGQLDMIMYDPYNCPKIISTQSHSVFPTESIYGAVSIKSTLAKRDLEDAYANLASFQKVVDRNGFRIGNLGMISGLQHPRPFTAIFAYRSDRKLETIAEQISALDNQLPAIDQRPDCVCVLGVGIIGPRIALRGDFNRLVLPVEKGDLTSIRKAGRHTLFEFYIQMVREMSKITLRPLDLRFYEDLPEIVGRYRVRRHDNFARQRIDGERPEYASKLSAAAIDMVATNSIYTTRLAAISMMADATIMDSQSEFYAGNVFVYNPRNLPPMDAADISAASRPEAPRREYFHPHVMQIDGQDYFVDMGALAEEHFELNFDMTYDELLS